MYNFINQYCKFMKTKKKNRFQCEGKLLLSEQVYKIVTPIIAGKHVKPAELLINKI